MGKRVTPSIKQQEKKKVDATDGSLLPHSAGGVVSTHLFLNKKKEEEVKEYCNLGCP